MKRLYIVILCIVMMSLLVACSPPNEVAEAEEMPVESTEVVEISEQDADIYDVEPPAEIVHSERIFDFMSLQGMSVADAAREFGGEPFGEIRLSGEADGIGSAIITNGISDLGAIWEDAGEARLHISEHYIMFEHSMGEIFLAGSGVIYYYVAEQNDNPWSDVWSETDGWTIFLYKDQAAYESGADPVGKLQVGIWG